MQLVQKDSSLNSLLHKFKRVQSPPTSLQPRTPTCKGAWGCVGFRQNIDASSLFFWGYLHVTLSFGTPQQVAGQGVDTPKRMGRKRNFAEINGRKATKDPRKDAGKADTSNFGSANSKRNSQGAKSELVCSSMNILGREGFDKNTDFRPTTGLACSSASPAPSGRKCQNSPAPYLGGTSQVWIQPSRGGECYL